MPYLDFSQQRLQGGSFRAQNLVGANFSRADIRGTDFTAADLTGASFQSAQAGSRTWAVNLVALLTILSALIVGLFGIPIADTINIDYLSAHGPEDAIYTFSTVCLFIVGLMYFRNLVLALLVNVLAILLLWLSLVMLEFYQTGDLLRGLINSDSASIDAATLTTTFLAGTVIVMTLMAVTLASWRMKTNQRKAFSLVEAIALAATLIATVPGILFLPGMAAKGGSIMASLLLLGVAFAVAKQMINVPEHYPFLRAIALRLTTLGATCFRHATLTRATFAHAQLNGTDFDSAQLSQTNFYHARALDYVRTGQTLLNQPNVRQLLTTGCGANQSFVGANLRGASLPGADLSQADLTGANLSHADVSDADLTQCNLSRVEALGTHFKDSHLTGACLQSWNIDPTTQLDGIHCEYIYLLANQCERRPSSGNFQPGEFTRLFENALHTVDLIFRNGLDFSAFVTAFKQAQAEYPDTELSIRSFENKGDGIVLVKINAAAQADKAALHMLLTQQYERSLKAMEGRYQSELQAKDQQIMLYQQHQSDLKVLTELLTQSGSSVAVGKRSDGKRVILRLGAGTPHTGFPAVLQIGKEGTTAHLETTGQLPHYTQIISDYDRWQQLYHQSCCQAMRISAPLTQVTNISYRDMFEHCYSQAATLQQNINLWLNSNCFRPIKDQLLEQLQPDESIRFILQTDDPLVQQLPLHLWNWFERYPKAELSLSHSTYQTSPSLMAPKNSVNILCILGDSTGIDVQQDRALLEQLPGTNIVLLTEPDRQQLNHALWEQSWDILFFAGHSTRQQDRLGHLCINPTDSLTLAELRHGIRRSIEHGLKLAIFNACSGLELVNHLTDLSLPPTIVMRSPVPDIVAQAFLKNFLLAFSQGLPLHLAVRDARERLQGLEHRYPFATWLPVIYENPTAKTLRWQDFCNL